MIHYHGGPLGCSDDASARILSGRHAFVSYGNFSQLSLVQEVCQSYAIDNGAFSIWRKGKEIDFDEFYAFVETAWSPAMDFFVIPDVIGGTEKEQDSLLEDCPLDDGAPVWHTNESLERLELLARSYYRVCIGSGPGLSPNSSEWWMRINQAFDRICDREGRPACRVHLLRGLRPEIFRNMPLASADSTMVATSMRESNSNSWTGTYRPISYHAKGAVLIDRIESFQSPSLWKRKPIQTEFMLWEQNEQSVYI